MPIIIKNKPNRKTLYKLYVKNDLSTKDISKIYNCDSTTVKGWLIKGNFKPKLCACGCGGYAEVGNDFINNHHSRGDNNPMKRPEVVEKIRLSVINQWKEPGYRDAHSGENHHQYDSVELICENCGHTYIVQNYRKDTSRFCSDKCRDENRSKEYVGKKAANWRGGKVTLICEQCGHDFEVNPHLKDTSRFCSKKCMGFARRGKNSIFWRGGVSFDPYCEKFNPTKKKEVRDNYDNCDYLTGIHRDICNKDKNGRIWELSVHHIDYNKQQGCNDIPWKLVPVNQRHNAMFNKNEPFWEKLILYALEYDKEYYKIEDEDFNILNI